VQIWSGYLAQTAPGWALLARGIANQEKTQPYEDHEELWVSPPSENYEGIIETDSWFGPLFTNIRLRRTNSPIDFHMHRPLFQVQPLLRDCYRDPSFEVLEAGDLASGDWRRYEATMKPNTDNMRAPGHYAVATRRRLRAADNAS
jgi:hypothetical protein